MIYIDTSVWIAALCPEANSARIATWFQSQEATLLIGSAWVRVEIASALSIKVRRGDIPSHDLSQRYNKLTLMSVLSPPWVGTEPIDYDEAYELCADPATKLRAGDALHLAIAKRLKCKRFFTLDDVLSANALAMGFEPVTL